MQLIFGVHKYINKIKQTIESLLFCICFTFKKNDLTMFEFSKLFPNLSFHITHMKFPTDYARRHVLIIFPFSLMLLLHVFGVRFLVVLDFVHGFNFLWRLSIIILVRVAICRLVAFLLVYRWKIPFPSHRLPLRYSRLSFHRSRRRCHE